MRLEFNIPIKEALDFCIDLDKQNNVFSVDYYLQHIHSEQDIIDLYGVYNGFDSLSNNELVELGYYKLVL